MHSRNDQSAIEMAGSLLFLFPLLSSLFCVQVLGQLLASCQTASGQDDKKNKGSELLEIYALQIQISSKRGDSLKMKELYDKTKDLTAAVKDPRSQSVIRESDTKATT